MKLDALNRQNQSFAARTLAAHQLQYPSEYVVRFLSSLKTAGDRPKSGLDIGFGSGQHLQLLMDYGYRASGIELVPEAGDRARSLFADHPLLGEIVIGDFRSTPFPPSSFDVIICWGVAFLRPLPEIARDLEQIRTLLKPDGHLCINFRTQDNWFYGLGDRLDEEHFLLDERAGAYAGSHYTFLAEATTRQVMQTAGFAITNFERWDWWKNNMKEHHSWWIVWATDRDEERRNG
ncbi:MAG: class I SAM-dependent methyltransferase [Elainellaceae cyanobacterium]